MENFNKKEKYLKIIFTKEGPIIESYILSEKDLLSMSGDARFNYLNETSIKTLIDELFDEVYGTDLSGKLFSTDKQILRLRVDLASIFKIADPYNIDLKSRKRELVMARNLFFVMLKVDEYGSHELVGSMCNRDHSTVTYALKAVRTAIEINDPLYHRQIKSILNKYRIYDKTVAYLKKMKG